MTTHKKCDNEFCNNIITPPYNILRLMDPKFGGHNQKKDVGYGVYHIHNRRKKLRLCNICFQAEKEMDIAAGVDESVPILDWSEERKSIADEKVVIKSHDGRK